MSRKLGSRGVGDELHGARGASGVVGDPAGCRLLRRNASACRETASVGSSRGTLLSARPELRDAAVRFRSHSRAQCELAIETTANLRDARRPGRTDGDASAGRAWFLTSQNDAARPITE